MPLHPSIPPTGPSSLWRSGDFLKRWSAQTVSVTGSLLGALQLTAILALAATPFQMSLLAAAGVLPALLFGFVVGAWVDRLRRRPVLIAADLLRAALLGSIPGAWLVGALHIEQLYLVAFLHGLLTTFFAVAYRSYLPSLWPTVPTSPPWFAVSSWWRPTAVCRPARPSPRSGPSVWVAG